MDASIVFKYFPELSATQQQQFVQLKDLYEDWNSKINVISRKDMDNFYVHHVLHSLAIAKVVAFKDFTEVMDAGTGGGFPGIPLAIMFPKVKFFLNDSIGKKIKVVKAVAESLGLENVKAEQLRMEQVNHSFDFIISRAVTTLPEFLQWTSNKFHKASFNTISNGILYLKGGDIREELRGLRRHKYKTHPIHEFYGEAFFETKKVVHIYK